MKIKPPEKYDVGQAAYLHFQRSLSALESDGYAVIGGAHDEVVLLCPEYADAPAPTATKES